MNSRQKYQFCLKIIFYHLAIQLRSCQLSKRLNPAAPHSFILVTISRCSARQFIILIAKLRQSCVGFLIELKSSNSALSKPQWSPHADMCFFSRVTTHHTQRCTARGDDAVKKLFGTSPSMYQHPLINDHAQIRTTPIWWRVCFRVCRFPSANTHADAAFSFCAQIHTNKHLNNAPLSVPSAAHFR